MAEPTIVPPTPTITQPSHPGEDTSPGLEQLQRAFDKALPEIKTEPTKKPQTKAEEVPAKPVAPPAEPVTPPAEPTQKPPDESHAEIPSFLEKALRGEESQAPPVETSDEWPEELPTFKTSEEAKERYKKWRGSYDKLKNELQTLRDKPSLNAEQLHRLEMLEGQNKQMAEMLTRVGVEHSAEFQNSIMRPRAQAWSEAVRIVQQAGGDPQSLAKAMGLSGKAQFEALDELFMEMPESAKIEAHEALRTFRRFEDARKATIANAPVAMEGIRKRETERQYQQLTQQRQEMSNLFDQAVNKLRNEAKLEVFVKTDQPEGKWWNDQADKLIEQARELYLENTDLNRVAMACILAPTADVYRKLFIQSQKKLGELQKLVNDRISSEPNLSEHGGPGSLKTSEAQLKADLNEPFSKVFLREFHKAQAQSR